MSARINGEVMTAEDFETTAPGNLYSALLAAQQEFDAVEKDGQNPLYKKSYATLGSVIKSVRPALSKHGILILQNVNTRYVDGRPVAVECQTALRHVPTSEAYYVDVAIPLGKADAQDTGSAITYGRRYSLMVACGVVGEEDDDDANATLAPRPAQRPSNAAPRAGKAQQAPPPAQAVKVYHRDEIDADIDNVAIDLYKTEETWKSKRPGLVQWATGGRTTDRVEMSDPEALNLLQALRGKVQDREAASVNSK